MKQQIPPAVVLAVDPGRDKCGVAVVTGEGEVVDLRTVASADLPAVVQDLARRHPLGALLVGDGTGSAAAMQALGSLDLPASPRTVPEQDTTLRARERYFKDHPPRGWRALVPRGLLIPPRSVDDYAALVMAEDWLHAQETSPEGRS